MYLPKDNFTLPGPSSEWEWETIWFIDKDSDFTDEQGWQYSSDFTYPFRKSMGLLDVVRRRKWVRICHTKPQDPKSIS